MTQAISSTVAPSEALMFVIATLTIEVSISSITAAEMTVRTMIHFLKPVSATAVSYFIQRADTDEWGTRGGAPPDDVVWEGSLLAGRDCDIHAHTGAERHARIIVVIDEQLDWHALRHLDEVTRSIIRRQ